MRVLILVGFLRSASCMQTLAMRFPFWQKGASEIDESQLVVLAKYGDSDAFDALVERYAPRLFAVAKRMVGADAAYDVVQDAFLAAFRSLSKFRGDSSFATYMHQIVINRCKHVLRRQKNNIVLREELIESKDLSAEVKVVAKMNRESIEQALQQIPEVFREALSLREFADLSYKEIAEVLKIEEGTVKSRIARARAQLREQLIEMGVSP